MLFTVNELCKMISHVSLLNWNRLSSETWARRNMTNMSVPWPPKGWRKPRRLMSRTWSTGPKSFPTHTTSTEVKYLWFKQISVIERTIIIFPFFLALHKNARALEESHCQNFIPYESFFTIQVEEPFWLLYM